MTAGSVLTRVRELESIYGCCSPVHIPPSRCCWSRALALVMNRIHQIPLKPTSC